MNSSGMYARASRLDGDACSESVERELRPPVPTYRADCDVIARRGCCGGDGSYARAISGERWAVYGLPPRGEGHAAVAPVPTHRADCDVDARDCSPRPTHRALCDVDARDISPACAQASERGVLVRGPVGIIGTSGRLPFSNSAVTAEYSCIAASSSSVSMCPAASFSAMLRPPGECGDRGASRSGGGGASTRPSGSAAADRRPSGTSRGRPLPLASASGQ